MQLLNKLEEQFADNLMESSVLRIQSLEMALERAIEDIALLHKNLAYVIQLKEEFECELKVREKRQETLLREYQRELAKKDAEIDELKSDRQEIAELLADAQQGLHAREASAMQREEEKRRLERIIEDQRSTVQALEEQLLAAKYSSDLSYQSISFDNAKIQEMERENDIIKFQLAKSRAAVEKEATRAKKLEKEVQGFKTWLGGVLGVRKVVEGCEGVLMQQIENRLNSVPKF